ncbi:MAG: sensor histidine kinase [Thermodesulfobacteriota bacterium]
MIVDDSVSVVNFISRTLEGHFRLQVAHSGEEAIRVMRHYKPDLVLLDVVMTGMDGYSVCRKIRRDRSLGFVKIIMVSSENRLQERLKGYEAGADDYISKPFEQEELLAKVRVFMRLKSLEDKLEEMNAGLNEQVKKRTEQLLDQAQMAAIGKNTAGIVHNLKNPLQAIMGYAELIELDDPKNQHIASLQKAAHRLQEMIATFLVTCHSNSHRQMTLLDMNKVLREQLELMGVDAFFKHQVRLDLQLQPVPLFAGVYSHFSQIMANLIQNAVDAMFETGEKKLTIRTYSDDQSIHIDISDTGVGIPGEALDRIFDPFYTTKPLSADDGRPTGTGLGLASCKEMIDSYGGTIAVRSPIGKGTVFSIRLPLKNKLV